MSKAPGSDLLGLRALQATRKLHLPTYVATRFLLDSSAGKSEGSWAKTILPRKYSMRDLGRFQKTTRFKKIRADGSYEYRSYDVPSPTTAITEALLLARFSTSAAFEKSTNVYSYLWPSSASCPYNFEHYVNGYKRRNRDIELLLEANKDAVVIVSDIEKFYPSILRNRAKVRLNNAMRDGGIDKETQMVASLMLEHLFAAIPGQRGIATGPEFSHVIGDLALASMDKYLSEHYQDAYFRYVDDIVLVVSADKVKLTEKRLRDLALDEELTVHPDKTEVVSGEEWLKHGPHHADGVAENSFESLVFLIKVYLFKHPGVEKKLEKRMFDNGFNIPIDRLVWSSRSKAFVRRLKTFTLRRWWVAIQALIANERDVIEKALLVRETVRNSLIQQLESGAPKGATRRRWYIQNLRYLTNRAFYLMSAGDLGFLIDPLSRLPEFAETVALLKMLVQGLTEDILKMPGAALMAGAGMLKQVGRKLQLPNAIANLDRATVDAISILLLFDVVSVDEKIYDQLEGYDKELLLFSGGQTPATRVMDDFSYIDEIRSLQLLRTKTDIISMIESRFSDQESVVFDALDIGGEYSYYSS